MPSSASPTDCESDIRRRVCKACDRCRIKKSKCDGKKPCSRCRNDDAICVFGGRKKKTDRVHPKGYVEILERQQRQLVKGIRALYDRQQSEKAWNGPQATNGYPPTHEILEYLGALEVDDSSDDECESSSQFEENLHQLRGSFDSQSQTSTKENKPERRLNSLPSPSQMTILPNQRPRDYYGKTPSLNFAEYPSTPNLSPTSLTATQSSPATSVDSNRWTSTRWMGERQSMFSGKPSISTNDLVNCSDLEFDDSPMQDAFEDTFLVASWDPHEALSELTYA